MVYFELKIRYFMSRRYYQPIHPLAIFLKVWHGIILKIMYSLTLNAEACLVSLLKKMERNISYNAGQKVFIFSIPCVVVTL